MGRDVQFKTLDPEKALMRIIDEGTRKQVKRCVAYLEQHLIKVEMQGATGKISYFTCGHDHDKRDPNWKPYRHLETFSKKEKIYMSRFLDTIEDWLGREISCECEILNDRKEVTRKRLSAAFGIDFGPDGNRNCDVV
jgi:hypothetical protein